MLHPAALNGPNVLRALGHPALPCQSKAVDDSVCRDKGEDEMTVHQSVIEETPEVDSTSGRKGRMETIIEAVATGAGNLIGFMAENGVLFVIFAVIWGAFGVGLIWSQGSIDAAWQWVGDLPFILQGVIWLLFLPVLVALWIWETTWPVAVRLLLVIGIGGWNLLVFLPRAVPR